MTVTEYIRFCSVAMDQALEQHNYGEVERLARLIVDELNRKLEEWKKFLEQQGAPKP